MQVVEEARAEARRRGDAATQTSDARFDERFQLGYGLTGACFGSSTIALLHCAELDCLGSQNILL